MSFIVCFGTGCSVAGIYLKFKPQGLVLLGVANRSGG